MKKRIFLIALLAAVVLCVSGALADGWDDAYSAFLEKTTPAFIDDSDKCRVVTGNIFDDAGYVRPDSAESVDMRAWEQCDKPLLVNGETSKFTVYAENGTPEYTMTYTPYRQPMSSTSTSYSSFGINNRNFVESFSITPDDLYRYLIVIKVVDADGNYINFRTTAYDTVTASSFADPTTLGGKVKWVVTQVIKPDMTDYEKALALHDWIIYNANYDSTLQIFGPEGVLLRGTGVCDSYSRAYRILLSEVGIENIVISSNSMNHSWNMIKINGKWYHVDCTWDDPIIEGHEEGGGAENHDYFCLTDAEIAASHEWGEYNDKNVVPPATGDVLPKAVSYVTRLGTGDNTAHIITFNPVNCRFTAPYDGVFAFDFSSECWYINFNTYGDGEDLIDTEYGDVYDCSFLLRKGQNVYFDMNTGNYTADYDVNITVTGNELSVKAQLPRYTWKIESEAFAGSDLEYVVIPIECRLIDSRAFADCASLICVQFLGDIPEIASDAFTGSGSVKLYNADGEAIDLK